MDRILFDVELIHDYKRDERARGKPYIATHRFYRGLTRKELNDLIKENELIMFPNNEDRVTFNIRGVTY